MDNNKYLNFCLFCGIPRVEGVLIRPKISAYQWMVKCARKAGLKITHCVPVPLLRNKTIVNLFKDFRRTYGDEVVPWLDTDRQLLDEVGIQVEPTFFHLYSKEVKKQLAMAVARMFKEAFNSPMEAVSYFDLDAASLKALKEASPELITAMAWTFEEGINVLRGHRIFDLEWLVFTEGGPWWPWIPRSGNSSAPAGADDKRLEMVCLPHLNRDMIQSFYARDDFYSSQSMDEMRSKSIRVKDIAYTRRFFAEYMRQAELNHGYAYYQFFEWVGCLDPNAPHAFEEPSAEYKKIFQQYVRFLGQQVKDGIIRQISTAEFGKWFLKHFNGGTPPTVGWWRDVRFFSGKEYLWHLDPNWRILFAADQGGSIIDLRPYAAKVSQNTGIDTANLWDGNYPFLIQNHHRYTTICKGMLKCNGIVKDLSEEFFTIKTVERHSEITKIIYKTKRLDFGGLKCTLETVCTIDKDGKIITERRLSKPSKIGETIEFCEYLKGTWGTTDLPANLAGIGLEVKGKKEKKGIIYGHRGRQIRMQGACECRVIFPKEDFSVVLSTENVPSVGIIKEGDVFQTFYTLSLEHTARLKEAMTFTTILRPEKKAVLPVNDAGTFSEKRFKTACCPSPHPLRCPRCLMAEREVHLLEKGNMFYCPFCSFSGNRRKIEEEYYKYR